MRWMSLPNGPGNSCTLQRAFFGNSKQLQRLQSAIAKVPNPIPYTKHIPTNPRYTNRDPNPILTLKLRLAMANSRYANLRYGGPNNGMTAYICRRFQYPLQLF